MSIHPSLASTEKDKKQRSVLKRIERLRIMREKEKWREGDKVYGLPKIKTIRIKIKKEKAAEKPTGAAPVEGAPTAGSTASGTQIKEQAPPKGTTAKASEKK